MECSESKHWTVTIDILEKHEPNPIHPSQQIKICSVNFWVIGNQMENFKLTDVNFYAALEKETLLKILSEKPIIKSDNDTLDLKFPGLHAIQLKKM